MQQDDKFRLFSEDEPRIGVIVGTGPSLSKEQLERVSHLKRFGANRSFEFDLDVITGCNYQFWDYYWSQVKEYKCIKWTTQPGSAEKYGINYIDGLWEPGLSIDKNYIHYHHGSGPQMVNIALHYGCEVMLLIGWDMRYPPGQERHYFGEDALTKGHHPRTGPQGQWNGLIEEMETINPDDYGIEIVNCTPDSAMTCFPAMDLSEALDFYNVANP